MSNYKLLYPSLQTCQSETEISNLFERHIKALLDEKKRMINEIIEWENNLIRQIQENVNQQKNRLEQECKNQLEYLQIKRQEFLDTALIYEERRDREEVRQLLEQCHALKYQLGSFEYLEQPILFIQVQKEKQQPADNKKSTINDHLRIEDNTSVPRSTYASSNQINQQLCTTTTSANNDHYVTGKDSLNLNVITNDDMVDKCPACLMTFPSTMGTNERSQHVNQHFGDY